MIIRLLSTSDFYANLLRVLSYVHPYSIFCCRKVHRLTYFFLLYRSRTSKSCVREVVEDGAGGGGGAGGVSQRVGQLVNAQQSAIEGLILVSSNDNSNDD